MDNAGLPEDSPKSQAAPFDDIPEALRETTETPTKPRPNRTWLISGLIAIGLGAGAGVSYLIRQPSPVVTNSPSPNPAVVASSSPSPSDRLLGHFPYAEAPQTDLEPVNGDGGVRLRKSAAAAYQQMTAAAQADGIILAPLSGFRSLNDQQHVFFDVKSERSQTPTQRAEVSAPPGYSEHHTGYAIDIGDGNTPATNLSPTFEQTAAFRWLQANAVRFSFEMSFPKKNSQGVTYEPWHWRFVGDRPSLETFYKARGK